ncbi:MAG: GatB/YqeY domain-containing protein [Gammaproteobacteria bacterium]|nr:GatB/YqeY domain-containing protein [Gammaproteobacteria bacterium]
MLREKITEDMKNAMRAKEQRRLGVIRLLLAAIKQREVDERITLDEPQILNVIDKMIKQRRDSLSQFQNAGRQDLADQESYELTVLEAYLPEQLSSTELEKLVHNALTESGATSMKDMGKVMTILKPQIQGRADVAEVSKKIKDALASL